MERVELLQRVVILTHFGCLLMQGNMYAHHVIRMGKKGFFKRLNDIEKNWKGTIRRTQLIFSTSHYRRIQRELDKLSTEMKFGLKPRYQDVYQGFVLALRGWRANPDEVFDVASRMFTIPLTSANDVLSCMVDELVPVCVPQLEARGIDSSPLIELRSIAEELKANRSSPEMFSKIEQLLQIVPSMGLIGSRLRFTLDLKDNQAILPGGTRAPETPKSTRNKATTAQTNRKEKPTKAPLVAALTLHHRYADGGCLNLEPIGSNALAIHAGVGKATASRFFDEEFEGHDKYIVICREPYKLALWLKSLNGEFSPLELYGRTPPAEREMDDDD